MLEVLLSFDADRLRRIEKQAGTLDLLSTALTTTADDPAALGDSSSDLTFTPITPCRFIDTRNAGGKIVGARTYRIDLNGATYGGAGACDPMARFGVVLSNPFPVAALAMNVTIVDTSAASTPGYLAVKPTTASPTTSLLNWYDAGTSVQVANQGVVATNQSLGGGGPGFAIETSGAVHVIVDVFGGFIVPQATAIQTTHVSTLLLPVGVNDDSDIATASCPSGYALVGGGCFTDNHAHQIYRTAPFGEAWSCASKNTAAVVSSIRATAICGRVPGR